MADEKPTPILFQDGMTQKFITTDDGGNLGLSISFVLADDAKCEAPHCDETAYCLFEIDGPKGKFSPALCLIHVIEAGEKFGLAMEFGDRTSGG